MPRIPPPKREDLPSSVQQIFNAREAAGVGKTHNAMLTFARIPEIVGPLYELLDRLSVNRHNKSLLEPRIRQLILLRIPRLNRCRYCTGHQTAHRAKQGYSTAEIDALLDDPLASPLFTEKEKAALQFVEEVTKDVSPSIATFGLARKHFTVDQILELSMVAGIWAFWNRMVETAKPDFDDDVFERLVAAGVDDRLLPLEPVPAAVD